jgi:RNA processing factor Prp31
MKNIDEKIKELGKEEKKIFSNCLINNLGCKEWRRKHGIIYSAPHIQTVKEETYKELYGERSE